jgi:EAL domain-containing protein (putative c-di-GMP-specific phosphodiesterase class I)
VLEPADFLDAIIDSDLDLPVQRWVLTTACADLAAARPGDGVAAPFVSVNLSPRQLGRPGLVDDVRAALDRSGLAARRLWLEVTEPVLGDPRHRPVLDRLAALGCRIAVDDFGAAATGLAQLRALPVHVLKLAPEYVAGLGTDRVSAGLVAAIAELAGVLGIQVVGEGVESAEQAALLAASGVALGQGFQLGRPEPGVPGADVETAPRILRAAASSRPGQPFAVVTDSRTSG